MLGAGALVAAALLLVVVLSDTSTGDGAQALAPRPIAAARAAALTQGTPPAGRSPRAPPALEPFTPPPAESLRPATQAHEVTWRGWVEGPGYGADPTAGALVELLPDFGMARQRDPTCARAVISLGGRQQVAALDAEPLARVTSNAYGEFEITVMLPDPGSLPATHDGQPVEYAPPRLRIRTPEAQGWATLDPELPDIRRVKLRSRAAMVGTVLGPDGAPLRARVALIEGDHGDVVSVSTCDARGGFTLDPGRWRGAQVLVEHPGLARVIREVDEGPQTIELQRGRSLAGRVVDGRGRPLRGMQVLLWDPEVRMDGRCMSAITGRHRRDPSLSGLASARKQLGTRVQLTDAAGRYRFEGLPRSPHRIFARGHGLAPADVHVPPFHEELDLFVHAPMVLALHVEDRDARAPLTGARVQAWRPHDRGPGETPLTVTPPREPGEPFLIHGAGTLATRLVIAAPGFQTREVTLGPARAWTVTEPLWRVGH